MTSPITIIKNDELLFEATNIQEAAIFLAEHLNTTKFKCYDPIERGYVYHIPYYVGVWQESVPFGPLANKRV